VIHDARDNLCAQSWPAELRETGPDLACALAPAGEAAAAPASPQASGGPLSIVHLPVGNSGWTRHLAAVTVEGDPVGSLSLLSRDKPDDLDRIALEQGAMAYALEIAKQRAVAAAEDRMRGEFLGALLTADSAREPALARRAIELGYNIEGHHCATVFAAEPHSAHNLALLASDFRALLLGTGIRTFVCPDDDHLVALCNADDPAGLRKLDATAQTAQHRTRERLESSGSQRRFVIGIGRPAPGLLGLRASLAQAREALELARAVFDGDRVLSFSDLGVYSLLFRLQGSDEMREFFDRTLGALSRYDAGHNTQLIPTLEAYFANLCNVSQTAEALYLHRNSLLYRLERIGEIAGLDLNEADDRFSLQLALRMRPFVADQPPSA
jgi:purine catabolism regulator